MKWLQNTSRLKNVLSGCLLTGGFTLVSTGLGMRFGLWTGLLTAGLCAIAYEWHLSRTD